MADSPSAILSRAADLIRDTAAAATEGPWRQHDGWWPGTLGVVASVLSGEGSDTSLRALLPTYEEKPATTARNVWNDARWIALMSPAVAPMIEKWLRDTAAYFDEFADYWVTIPEQARDALALARAVLGAKEEQ